MEIVHFDKVMQMIKSFSPLERVLLSTAGTLQTAPFRVFLDSG